MIIDEQDVAQVAAAMLSVHQSDLARLRKIDNYISGKHAPPYVPTKGATQEYRWIKQRSVRNFLPLILSVISQNLHVDGYRRSDAPVDATGFGTEPDPSWDAFRANRMISRQHGIHRATLKHGVSYVTVMPGTMAVGEEQKQMPVINPVSAGRMSALYADAVNDEWPQLAVEVTQLNDSAAPGKVRTMVTVYDDDQRYILMSQSGSNAALPLEIADSDDPYLNGKSPVASHGLGVCPVVRFLHEYDLDGENVSGEIEPLIVIQDQINFDTFNLMMAEQFASFRQRWVTGIAAVDEQGRAAEPFRPGIDRMFASDDAATKFGEFDATPLQPYIDSREAGIRHMSTISQVPPFHLLGQIANLSAEALAAASDGLSRKVDEEKAMLTDSWRNTFRLCSKAAGDTDGWNDLNGVVVWRDTSPRSFAATIDALGKVAQMLGVPVEELWARVPGVTADDVDAWRQARARALAQATADQAAKTALAVAAQQLASPYPPQPGAGGTPPGPGMGPAPNGQQGPAGPQGGPPPENPAIAAAQKMLAAPAPKGPGGKPPR